MPSTKRNMNWTGVSFAISGGATVTITGVTNVSVANNGNLLKFSGDADRFNSTVVNDFNDPMATVTTAHIAALLALAPGMRGTFSATLNDAKNGTGSGAITYTIASAVVGSNDHAGAHRQFASGTLNVGIEAPDGQTNPVSVSISP